jgi:rubrerythrin
MDTATLMQTINHDAIPEVLKSRRQWVTWTYQGDVDPKTNKQKKVLKNPHTGGNAQSDNPQTWSTYKHACNAAKQRNHAGIGFVFTDNDPYVGVDLDHCRNKATGEILPWAVEIIQEFNTYTEVSPSETGVKLFMEGDIPSSVKNKSAGIEIYKVGRYFTVTGWHVEGTPKTINYVNGPLENLHTQTKKQVEVTTVPASIIAPATRNSHASEWVETKMQWICEEMDKATDGTLHNRRLELAKLAGGIVALGLLSEQEAEDRLYAARRPEANHHIEREAIRDGIEYGKSSPLSLPQFPTDQAIILKDGIGCCPSCDTPIKPSKFNYYNTEEPGWYCPQCKAPMTWPLSAYTPSQEIVLTHEDVVQTSKSRITDLITKSYFTEAELGNVKPPTWLVKGYIALGEVTVVYGPSDSGKSTFIMDWICRICQHYPAMYVAGEDGSGVLVKRGAWINHYKRGTNGNFNMRNDALDLFDSRAVDAFIQEVFNLGLKVVVIDTLSQCSGAADENGSDMKQVMASLQKIAHVLNVAVIVAHHATKDGSNYRGYSGIKANSYGLISVSKINEVVYLEIERIKNTRPSPKRAFKFVSVETQYRDDDDIPIAAPVLKPAKDVLPGDGLTPQEAELLSTIYEAQQGMEHITLTNLKNGTKWADSVFYKVWKRLARESLIKKIGGKGIKQIGAMLEITIDGETLLRKSGALDEEKYDDEPSTDVLFEINTKLLHGATSHTESTYGVTASTVEQPEVTSELLHSNAQVHAPVEWTSKFDLDGYGVTIPQSEAENDRYSEVLAVTPQSFESNPQATYSCSLVSLDTRGEQVSGAELVRDENEDIDDDDRDFIDRVFGNGSVRRGSGDEQQHTVSDQDSGLAATAHTSQAYSCAEQSIQSSASSSDGVRQANAAMGEREQGDTSEHRAPHNDETVM